MDNHLFEYVEELQQQFPEVDFNVYELMDEQSWSSYEEGGAAYLFLHIPTDQLYALEDLHSVMVGYEPPDFMRDIHAVTLDEWFEIKESYTLDEADWVKN